MISHSHFDRTNDIRSWEDLKDYSAHQLIAALCMLGGFQIGRIWYGNEVHLVAPNGASVCLKKDDVK